MIQLLSNAFNDPSNPWYYVVGVIFLLLIFGAVAFYMIWTGKKNKEAVDKKDEQKDETTNQTGEDKTEADGADTISDAQEPSDK